MKQSEFIGFMHEEMYLPVKTIKKLLKAFRVAFQNELYIGNSIVIPRLGRFKIVARPSRNRHNVHTGTIDNFPGNNVVVMTRYGAGNQYLTPTWNQDEEYKQYANFPNIPLAKLMSEQSNIDLLLCNQFVNALTLVITDALSIDEKVPLTNIGTFTNELITVRGLIPSAPDSFWMGVTACDLEYKFCAIAFSAPDASVMASKTGGRWEAFAGTLEKWYTCISYNIATGTLCALAQEEDGWLSSISTDAENWSDYAQSEDFTPYGIAYNQDEELFIAVGYAEDYIAVGRSADGMSWSMSEIPEFTGWRSIVWASELGYYCAVGSGPSNLSVALSLDGIIWEQYETPTISEFLGVAWSPELELFVAVGYSSENHNIWYSPTGIEWTPIEIDFAPVIHSVCWSSEKGRFAAVGWNGTGSWAIWSEDGINWNLASSFIVTAWVSVCYSPITNLFVAVSQSGSNNRVMISEDADNWTVGKTPPFVVGEDGKRNVIKFRPSQKIKDLVN